MSKSNKDGRTSRSSIRSTHSHTSRPPAFLAPRAAPTVSTSTSVGLTLAGLPSTPSPILIGPGREEGLGYFSLKRRGSNPSHGLAPSATARPVAATAEGHFITGKHRRGSSSSANSSLDASDLLAALNVSIDGDVSHSQPSPTSTTGTPYTMNQTPGVRHTAISTNLPSRGSVDTFGSRGSVSSFADDVSSSHASPAPVRSATPESFSRNNPRLELRSKAISRLQHPSVKRTQSGHGLTFIPSPAAPSVTSATSQGGSSIRMPEPRSSSDRLAEVLAHDGDHSSNMPPSPASPTQSEHAPGAQHSLAMSDKQISTMPGRVGEALTEEDQRRTRSKEVEKRFAIDTSSINTASPTLSAMDGERNARNNGKKQREDRYTRSTTPSPPSRTDSRNSGKYRTPSSSIDGDVFYTPTQTRAPPLPQSTPSSTRPRHHHQKRNSKHWVPTGASDSDDEMQLNDVDENASGSSGGSTSLASSTLTDSFDMDRPHCKIPSILDEPSEHYIPPYEPRKRRTETGSSSGASSSTALMTGSTDFSAFPTELEGNHRYAVTLVVSLGRQSSDALPFKNRRVELDLVWDTTPSESLWSLIPGSRYVPQWHLRPAGRSSGYEQVGLVRRAVGKVPIVGAYAAAWL